MNKAVMSKWPMFAQAVQTRINNAPARHASTVLAGLDLANAIVSLRSLLRNRGDNPEDIDQVIRRISKSLQELIVLAGDNKAMTDITDCMEILAVEMQLNEILLKSGAPGPQ